MQGLNPLTMQCIYSTPCGWCTKWDKKCDKKIGCESPKQPNAEVTYEIKSIGAELRPFPFGTYEVRW
jgi:hypothetical protein